MAVGTFQLTLAVPRRSSVPATMSPGHWIHGGSASKETQRKVPSESTTSTWRKIKISHMPVSHGETDNLMLAIARRARDVT